MTLGKDLGRQIQCTLERSQSSQASAEVSGNNIQSLHRVHIFRATLIRPVYTFGFPFPNDHQLQAFIGTF